MPCLKTIWAHLYNPGSRTRLWISLGAGPSWNTFLQGFWSRSHLAELLSSLRIWWCHQTLLPCSDNTLWGKHFNIPYLSHISISTHTFSLTLVLVRIAGSWSRSQLTPGEKKITPWTSCESITRHIERLTIFHAHIHTVTGWELNPHYLHGSKASDPLPPASLCLENKKIEG